MSTTSHSTPTVPHTFPTSGFEILDSSEEVEEETLPTYRPEKYYPVHIGEVLGGRYQVVAKIGFGVTSTVWLGHDMENNELEVYERINAIQTDLLGKTCIRKLLGHFHIEGPYGRHVCLVHQPLGLTYRNLDFLHTEAGVIHTEQMEMDSPTPRKILDDGRTIYTSQIIVPGNGLPLLSDLGECRLIDQENNADIMLNAYTSPEVILKMDWDLKVDIWNVALLAWDIVPTRCFFQGLNADDIFDDRIHVAEMIALLGSPPPDFVSRSKVGHVFWDEKSNWKDLAPITNITLECLGAEIKGEDKEGFHRFLRKALKWRPEDRPTARELLNDEWLLEGLGLPSEEAQ